MTTRVLGRTLIDRERIRQRVRELGRALSNDLAAALRDEGHDPQDGEGDIDRVTMLPVMTGAVVFVADLIREMPLKLSMSVVTVSSYPGQATRSKGAALRGSLPDNLAGRHVVIVDDILDSGGTLELLRAAITEQGAASVRACVLLNKLGVPKKPGVLAEHIGFDIPDEFVVGYGLDFDGFYRNLPDIKILEER